MDDVFYTSAILRERADLRTRRPTRIQLQRLATEYHGRAVRSVGIVRQVEVTKSESGEPGIRITVTDEEGGEEVRYDVNATFLSRLSAGSDREQFERWRKGQKVIVSGLLDWADAEAVPIVLVQDIRYS